MLTEREVAHKTKVFHLEMIDKTIRDMRQYSLDCLKYLPNTKAEDHFKSLFESMLHSNEKTAIKTFIKTNDQFKKRFIKYYGKDNFYRGTEIF